MRKYFELLLIFCAIVSVAAATAPTYRHPGFILWGTDIDANNNNITNIQNLTTHGGKELQNPELGASYVIFADGTTIYAKNGSTGKIDFSGVDVLQTAINSLSSGGKIVIISDLTEQPCISIPSNIEICGIGDVTIDFLGAGFKNKNQNSFIDQNIKIHDITIVGTALNGSYSQNRGIYLRNVSDSMIYNVKVHNFTSDGIVLEDSVNSSIRYSYSYNNGNCIGSSNIILYNTEDSIVEGCVVWGQGTTQCCDLNDATRGISVSYGTSNIIKGNHILNATDNGIMIYQSHDNVIESNVVNDTKVQGIEVEGNNNTIVSNIVKFGNLTADGLGIYLLGGVSSSNDNVVFGNLVSKTRQGITLSKANRSLITGNKIIDCQYGISCTEGSKNNSIVGNSICNSVHDGINVGSNTCYTTISGNVIENNGGYGIYSNSPGVDRTLIMSNVVRESGTAAITTSSNDIVNNNFGANPFNHGNLASAPTPYGEGDSYYDITDHKRYVYDGTSWQALW